MNLFEEYAYFDYKFPEPQYLGAKYVHRQWIGKFVPEEAKVVLDAFGGSQSMAFLFKQMGKQTITNDFLKFDSEIGKALIENPGWKLEKTDLEILLSENQDHNLFNLMEVLFTDLFFPREDAAFADAVRSNICRLDNPFKQSLALTVMCRSMTRKVTMGHFAHTQAMNYAADPARVKRNRSLVRPLKDLFLELVPVYNAAIFDNKETNKSYNEDILELLPSLNNVDFAYFDPPYCKSHADYQSFYHLLETYVMYWKDKDFVNGTKRYEPKRHSGFDKINEAKQSLETLFKQAANIPTWLVSYNDRSYPDIDTMTDMLSRYKNVKVERKPYSNCRGGKGSVAGSSEILFVCTTSN